MNIICFDWDDTLLPSTHISSLGYDLGSESIDPKLDEDLKKIEKATISLLKMAMSQATVMIITNSQEGWVLLSATKFIPGVVPLLKQCTIVSARSRYEHAYPDDPYKWKECAFREISATHVISFGDSHTEREAVHKTQGKGVRVKNVKFADRPSIEQLHRQIEFIEKSFEYIYTHSGSLDLMLTITMI